MFRPSRVAAAVVLQLALLFATPAASLPQFEPTYVARFQTFTNDGVYALTPDQAEAFGAPTADRIGFLRLRARGVDWSAGDWFDAASIRASTRDDAKLLAIVNGTAGAALIDYAGAPLDPLGETVFAGERDVYRAVAFVFDSAAGRIVFTGRGTTTFAGGQSRGAYAGLLPSTPSFPADDRGDVETGAPQVPLPAPVWLMLAGVSALIGLALSRRAA